MRVDHAAQLSRTFLASKAVTFKPGLVDTGNAVSPEPNLSGAHRTGHGKSARNTQTTTSSSESRQQPSLRPVIIRWRRMPDRIRLVLAQYAGEALKTAVFAQKLK